ncbi:MAG TPA: helix-turn-helix domain-containing protein [Gaiellaceae bacterium]
MTSPDRYVDAAEVATLLSVPVSWVRERTRTGEIPCRRFGRYVRFDTGEVLAWAEDQRAGGGTWRKHTTRGDKA